MVVRFNLRMGAEESKQEKACCVAPEISGSSENSKNSSQESSSNQKSMPMVATQEDVLKTLHSKGQFLSSQYASEGNVDHQKVVGVLRSLAGLNVVTLADQEVEKLSLSTEAVEYAKAGSPEAQVYNFVKVHIRKSFLITEISNQHQ